VLQQLSGRLGNQLFQWSFSHTLATHYDSKVTLFMDASHANGFKGDDLYSALKPCTHIDRIIRNDLLGQTLKILDKISTLQENSGKFLNRHLRLLRTFNSYELPELPSKRPRLITGFYINSRIVESSENIILPELERLIDAVHINESLPTNYQYIHIRRGDYVVNETSYGLLGASHYLKHLDGSIPLVIGTDDPESSASVIAALKPDFVFSPSNSTAWQALKMMANAEKLILANSTLSWWGGFLAANRGSTVYSPSPFYKNQPQINSDMQYKKFISIDSEFL
jgi:hypothetical protein